MSNNIIYSIITHAPNYHECDQEDCYNAVKKCSESYCQQLRVYVILILKVTTDVDIL